MLCNSINSVLPSRPISLASPSITCLVGFYHQVVFSEGSWLYVKFFTFEIVCLYKIPNVICYSYGNFVENCPIFCY